MVAEELVAGVAPQRPGAEGVGLAADGGVQLEDPPLPVEEVELVQASSLPGGRERTHERVERRRERVLGCRRVPDQDAGSGRRTHRPAHATPAAISSNSWNRLPISIREPAGAYRPG
jgi:hypothetical protein